MPVSAYSYSSNALQEALLATLEWHFQKHNIPFSMKKFEESAFGLCALQGMVEAAHLEATPLMNTPPELWPTDGSTPLLRAGAHTL